MGDAREDSVTKKTLDRTESLGPARSSTKQINTKEFRLDKPATEGTKGDGKEARNDLTATVSRPVLADENNVIPKGSVRASSPSSPQKPTLSTTSKKRDSPRSPAVDPFASLLGLVRKKPSGR